MKNSYKVIVYVQRSIPAKNLAEKEGELANNVRRIPLA